MQIKPLLLTLLCLGFSSGAWSATSPGTICASNFSDTEEQPTPFIETDGAPTGKGIFTCAPGEMSSIFYAYVAAQGQAATGTVPSTVAAMGAAKDAAPCGLGYAGCYAGYYSSYSAAYTTGMATLNAKTTANLAKAEMLKAQGAAKIAGGTSSAAASSGATSAAGAATAGAGGASAGDLGAVAVVGTGAIYNGSQNSAPSEQTDPNNLGYNIQQAQSYKATIDSLMDSHSIFGTYTDNCSDNGRTKPIPASSEYNMFYLALTDAIQNGDTVYQQLVSSGSTIASNVQKAAQSMQGVTPSGGMDIPGMVSPATITEANTSLISSKSNLEAYVNGTGKTDYVNSFKSSLTCGL